MSKSAAKPITDASGHAPKVGDNLTVHVLTGDKPRVVQATGKVSAIRDDGTLDLVSTLQNRPITLEGLGPVGNAPFSVGWSRPQPAPQSAAPRTVSSGNGDDKPPTTAGGETQPQPGEQTGSESKPPAKDARPASNSSNPGPLKPIGG